VLKGLGEGLGGEVKRALGIARRAGKEAKHLRRELLIETGEGVRRGTRSRKQGGQASGEPAPRRVLHLDLPNTVPGAGWGLPRLRALYFARHCA